MNCERLTKKKQKNARQRAATILLDVQKDNQIKEKYKFDKRIVGSGYWGTMIEDVNGEYDIDYQMLLTHNSKEYIDNEFEHPTTIKTDFYNAFVRHKKVHEVIQNSTTAITLISDEYNFHIDFVIIDINQDSDQIIRRNNKKESPTVNEFTWNPLPNRSDAFSFFKIMSHSERQLLVNNRIIPEKCKEKQKSEGDPTKISSTNIFIREVMAWKNEH